MVAKKKLISATFFYFIIMLLSCKQKQIINTQNVNTSKILKEKIEYLEEGTLSQEAGSDISKISKISYYDESGQLFRETRFLFRPFNDASEQQVTVTKDTLLFPDMNKIIKTTFKCENWGFDIVEASAYDIKNNLLSLEITHVSPDSIEAIKKCTFKSNQGKTEDQTCTIFMTGQKISGKYYYNKDGVLNQIVYSDLNVATPVPIMEEIFEYEESGQLHEVRTYNIRNPDKILMRTIRFGYTYW